METTEFQYPRVAVGTSVMVSKDHENFSDPVLGQVFNAKQGSADILVMVPGRGPQFIQSAMHRNDPRIKTNPDWFDPAKGYENSGVFELAESEVLIRQIAKDYQQLRSTMMAIQARLEALEAHKDPPAQSVPDLALQKRGPGRPRKPQTVEA